jgi:hypothetical protein
MSSFASDKSKSKMNSVMPAAGQSFRSVASRRSQFVPPEDDNDMESQAQKAAHVRAGSILSNPTHEPRTVKEAAELVAAAFAKHQPREDPERHNIPVKSSDIRGSETLPPLRVERSKASPTKSIPSSPAPKGEQLVAVTHHSFISTIAHAISRVGSVDVNQQPPHSASKPALVTPGKSQGAVQLETEENPRISSAGGTPQNSLKLRSSIRNSFEYIAEGLTAIAHDVNLVPWSNMTEYEEFQHKMIIENGGEVNLNMIDHDQDNRNSPTAHRSLHQESTPALSSIPVVHTAHSQDPEQSSFDAWKVASPSTDRV